MRDRRHAGDILLTLDPGVDRLHVRPGCDVALGQDGLLNAVDLCDDVELSCVPRQDLAAVFKLVLSVSTTAQADSCDDAVRDSAGARVDVHRKQRNCGSVVGSEANELWKYLLAILLLDMGCVARDEKFFFGFHSPLTPQSPHLHWDCRCPEDRAPF